MRPDFAQHPALTLRQIAGKMLIGITNEQTNPGGGQSWRYCQIFRYIYISNHAEGDPSATQFRFPGF